MFTWQWQDATVTLSIAPDQQIAEHQCPGCGGPFLRITGSVHRDGKPYAVYYASCHHHGGNDMLLDAVFGTWDREDHSDHVTFGCRIAPVPGQPNSAAQLVQAATSFADAPLFGQRLSPDEAEQHPRLEEFRTLVTHILSHDIIVAQHAAAQPQPQQG